MLTPLAQLWLPIFLSAALVFIASAIIWTVIGWHNGDWRGLPDEPAAANAMRSATPGWYMIPFSGKRDAWRDPEFQKRRREGPVAFVTIAQAGDVSMTKQLVQTFIYYLIISIFVAYVGATTLTPGTDYLQVFRVIGTTAILAYAAGHIHESIWFSRPWGVTLRNVIDGVIYGLLTAGVFGWRWPTA
jgi:hypothetical protein